MKKRRRRRKQKRTVDDGGENRLSSLPDDILVDILRLLPFDKAVATSVLSKRWVHLWTHHTSIVIRVDKFMPDSLFKLPELKRPNYILNTIPKVSHTLGQLISPYLTTFEIYASTTSYSKADYDAVSSCFEHWLGLICGHDIQVINLSVGHEKLWDKLFVWLPSCVFQTKSLVKLVLKNVNYNCRLPSVITLPNLKHLELDLGCLDDFHRRLLGNLSESFPLLQILRLRFHWDDGLCLILSSPSLLSLSVVMWNFYYFPAEPWKIVIDAPNLDYIKVRCKHEGSFEFVSNPTALATAVIDIYGEYHDKLLGLIKGISYARFLTLVRDDFWDFIDALNFWEDNRTLPLFGELIELHIVISERSHRWRGFPVAMLAKVKKIHIEYKYGIEKEMKLLKCILSSSSVLELLLVSLAFWDETNQEEGRKICEAILRLERSSKNCRIQFTGDCSTESSSTSDFRDLVCETAVL